MKINRLFLLFLLFFSMYLLAYRNCVVFYKDGTQKSYTIGEHGGIYFENNRMLISEVYGRYDEIELNSVQKLVFDNHSVGVEDVNEDEQIMVFPNPTRGVVSLQGVTQDDVVSLYSLDGYCLLSQETITSLNAQMPYISSGFYLLKVKGQIIKICKL